jgi:hypothetical protein
MTRWPFEWSISKIQLHLHVRTTNVDFTTHLAET